MRLLFLSFIFIIYTEALSQQRSYPFYQLYQLDSIGKTGSIGRHFGVLYYDFLLLIESRLDNADTTTQRLVRHFETVFAQFYIEACIAHEKGEPIALPAWRTYFTNNTLNEAQYYLLGANAHLNGGLAEAIANSYSPEEWKMLKKRYKLFNKPLNITFRKVYRHTVNTVPKARLLSVISLGLTRHLGNYYLYKWRKRQMRLIEYYFTADPPYHSLLAKINRKKERIDNMIIRQLK